MRYTNLRSTYLLIMVMLHCVPKKHVTTFSTITLTIVVRLQ